MRNSFPINNIVFFAPASEMRNLSAFITAIVGILSLTVKIAAHPVIRDGSSSRANSTMSSDIHSLEILETEAQKLSINRTVTKDGVQDKAYTLRKGIFGGAAAGAAVGIAVGMDQWFGPKGSEIAASLTLSSDLAGPTTSRVSD